MMPRLQGCGCGIHRRATAIRPTHESTTTMDPAISKGSSISPKNITPMATLMTPMTEAETNNPAVVKVVATLDGHALYFSRSLIPYPRNRGPEWRCFKHIGVYAYRRDFLLRFAALPPSPLEVTESLEQLRALENGYRIRVIETPFRSIGVDTPADLEEVRNLFRTAKGENV